MERHQCTRCLYGAHQLQQSQTNLGQPAVSRQSYLQKKDRLAKNGADLFPLTEAQLIATIVKAKPVLEDELVSDWEKACVLRKWVAENLTLSARQIVDHTTYGKSELLKFIEECMKGSIGIVCGGYAKVMNYIYGLFDFASCSYNFGILGVHTHVFNLVSPKRFIKDVSLEEFGIQDAMLNCTYELSDGLFLSLGKMYDMLLDRKTEDIVRHIDVFSRFFLDNTVSKHGAFPLRFIEDGKAQMERFFLSWHEQWSSNEIVRVWCGARGMNDCWLNALLFHSPRTPPSTLDSRFYSLLDFKLRERGDSLLQLKLLRNYLSSQ